MFLWTGVWVRKLGGPGVCTSLCKLEIPQSGICLTQVGIFAVLLGSCVTLAQFLDFVETQFHGRTMEMTGPTVRVQGTGMSNASSSWVHSECVTQAALVTRKVKSQLKLVRAARTNG